MRSPGMHIEQIASSNYYVNFKKRLKEVFCMSKKMTGIVHFFVMVALYFIVSMLPPFGMVTPLGMKILGAFVAIVYGWVFMDLLFASIFGFLFLRLLVSPCISLHLYFLLFHF